MPTNKPKLNNEEARNVAQYLGELVLATETLAKLNQTKLPACHGPAKKVAKLYLGRFDDGFSYSIWKDLNKNEAAATGMSEQFPGLNQAEIAAVVGIAWREVPAYLARGKCIEIKPELAKNKS